MRYRRVQRGQERSISANKFLNANYYIIMQIGRVYRLFSVLVCRECFGVLWFSLEGVLYLNAIDVYIIITYVLEKHIVIVRDRVMENWNNCLFILPTLYTAKYILCALVLVCILCEYGSIIITNMRFSRYSQKDLSILYFPLMV